MQPLPLEQRQQAFASRCRSQGHSHRPCLPVTWIPGWLPLHAGLPCQGLALSSHFPVSLPPCCTSTPHPSLPTYVCLSHRRGSCDAPVWHVSATCQPFRSTDKSPGLRLQRLLRTPLACCFVRGNPPPSPQIETCAPSAAPCRRRVGCGSTPLLPQPCGRVAACNQCARCTCCATPPAQPPICCLAGKQRRHM